MSPVSQRNQTKRDYDQENGLFVNVPAEQERGISAERDRTDEIFPCRLREELD